MQWQVWLSFFLACWVIAISPGSGAILSMSHGLRYGLWRSTATIAGLQLGLLFIMLVAGVGVGSLLLASEAAFWAVKIIGALYLMYLGTRQFFQPPSSPAAIAVAGPAHSAVRQLGPACQGGKPGVSQAGGGQLNWRQRLLTGFLTNATNPKGILFMVAVLPQFIDPAGSLPLQLTIIGATMCAVDVVVMGFYAGGASVLARWLKSPSAQRWQNRIFGGLLIFIGVGLLAVQRSG